MLTCERMDTIQMQQVQLRVYHSQLLKNSTPHFEMSIHLTRWMATTHALNSQPP